MTRPKLSPTEDLGWTEKNELVTLEFNLIPHQDTYLSPDYSKGLHAWLLNQVQQTNPDLSQILHDDQSEKAFTISRLDGDLTPAAQKIQLTSNQTYKWYLSALSGEVVQWLGQWLKNIPDHLELRAAPLEIKEIKFLHPPTTYQKLFSGRKQKNFSLSFISPTSFRRKGHHFPLPVPTNLFHSYLRRWNDFSGRLFPQEEFLNWIDEFVIIKRHQLQSIKVAGGKRGSVTGFTGAIELTLASGADSSPEFSKLYSALGKLAPYCGTGHKTTFGLGQTRHGWVIKLPSKAIASLEEQLAVRIEELTELLLKQQKRPEGNRALKVCQTRATILARWDLGESLQEIALDLEMPYQTVKTYAKIARRIVKSS